LGGGGWRKKGKIDLEYGGGEGKGRFDFAYGGGEEGETLKWPILATELKWHCFLKEKSFYSIYMYKIQTHELVLKLSKNSVIFR
jgi:hypothetical protein